jgi:hypothetical protein|tara:strand:- start:629 stop:1504 length:876 start_codon:yes stop_codon:yes gene_type:complete
MLPDNFDFAMLPAGSTYKLEDIGMLASTIENIDYAMTSWLKEDLKLSVFKNDGYKSVPVFWQTPERSFQIKTNTNLRDDGGSLLLPVVSVERTGITKDPARKGSYQAHTYSEDRNGRTGRFVIAREIVQDKTRNFAVAAGIRANTPGTKQRYYPRVNKQIVVRSLSVPIPVYVNIDYKIVIKAEYQTQMNDLIAPFMTRTGQINSFIMRRNGHLYEAFIDQGFTHSNNVDNLEEETRMFTSEVNIRVLGYLIGEGKNDDRPIVRVDENLVEITYPQEGIVKDVDGFMNITS